MSDVNEPGKLLFAGENAERESRIERFEEAWQSGDPPQLGEFLPSFDNERLPTLVELVHVDLECRLKRGDAARVEKYLDDYPELASGPEIAMNLIATEYEIRSRREADLSIDEFCERFPQFSEELSERLTTAKKQSEYHTASIYGADDPTILMGTQRAEPQDDALVGSLVRDYRIVEKIGEGGMGTVYKAVHQRLGKTVAVKVLTDALLRDERAAARFDREMLAVGKLDHANIVRATDAGEANGRHFLVMEYVDGVDVGSLAGELGKLSIPQACEVVRQAAVGLQHIHEHGLIHRDIKPSNLMLAVSDQPSAVSKSAVPNPKSAIVKLLDLGLARLHDPAQQQDNRQLTSTGQLMGTFDYMAPEQTIGGDVDIRADIYSLGSTLYRLLAGRAPFEGDEYATPAQKIIALVQQEPTPIKELRDDLPEELARILERMLAKEVGDRFQTPAEAAEALAPFCAGADLLDLFESSPYAPLQELRPAEREGASAVGDSHDPAPVMPASLPKTKRDGFAGWRKYVVVASAAMILLLAAVIYVKTDRGTLVVKAGEGIEISVEDNVVTIQDTKSGRKYKVRVGKEKSLPSGEYEILVEDNTGLSFKTKTFEISRGGKKLLLVELEKKDDTPPPIVPDPPAGFEKALSTYALVARPAKLDGLYGFTIETVAPRGAINDVKFNPAGDLFAVASDDGSVRLFKPDGTLQQVLIGHESPVLALAWSPDGKQLASVSGILGQQCVIHIWDVASGKVIDTIEQRSDSPSKSLDWHPDGRRLAIGGWHHNLPCIWDLKQGKLLQKITPDNKTGVQNTLAWSHDGKLLALAGAAGKQIEIRDGDTYELLSTLTAETQGHLNCIWSPTERKLAFVAHNPTTFQIWAFDDPRKPPRPVETAPMDQFAGVHSSGKSIWSPDGKTIAIGQYKTRWRVGLLSGDKITPLTTDRDHDHAKILYAASWRGHHLVTASSDGLRIWNTETKQLSRHVSCFGPTIQQVGLSHDGQILAVYPLSVGRGGGFIDMKSQKTVVAGIGSHFAWSNTERRLAVRPAANRWGLYDYYTRKTTAFVQDEHCNLLSWSPDDRYLIGANHLAPKTYRVWDMRADKPKPIKDLTFESAPLGDSRGRPIWSEKGDYVATRFGNNNNVVVWNTVSWTKRASYQSELRVNTFGLSPDGGRVFINRSDARVEFHGQGKPFKPRGHKPGSYARVHWTADGNHVFSAGTLGELIVWDAKLSERIDTFKIPSPSHHTSHLALDQFQFSKDGELLMVAGPGAVTFWKSRSGEPARTVLSDGTIISPEGHFRSPEGKTDADYVYVVKTPNGNLNTLTPSEMMKRHNWKNVPGNAGM